MSHSVAQNELIDLEHKEKFKQLLLNEVTFRNLQLFV